MLEFPRFEKICRLHAEKRMSDKQVFFDTLKALSPSEKYDYFLRENPKLSNRVSQKLLSGFLGMTPESLSRIRKRRQEKRILNLSQ
jgi:hypothetical protein